MRYKRVLSRFLAVLLSAELVLPAPSLGLRPMSGEGAGLEELREELGSEPAAAGLEEVSYGEWVRAGDPERMPLNDPSKQSHGVFIRIFSPVRIRWKYLRVWRRERTALRILSGKDGRSCWAVSRRSGMEYSAVAAKHYEEGKGSPVREEAVNLRDPLLEGAGFSLKATERGLILTPKPGAEIYLERLRTPLESKIFRLYRQVVEAIEWQEWAKLEEIRKRAAPLRDFPRKDLSAYARHLMDLIGLAEMRMTMERSFSPDWKADPPIFPESRRDLLEGRSMGERLAAQDPPPAEGERKAIRYLIAWATLALEMSGALPGDEPAEQALTDPGIPLGDRFKLLYDRWVHEYNGLIESGRADFYHPENAEMLQRAYSRILAYALLRAAMPREEFILSSDYEEAPDSLIEILYGSLENPSRRTLELLRPAVRRRLRERILDLSEGVPVPGRIPGQMVEEALKPDQLALYDLAAASALLLARLAQPDRIDEFRRYSAEMQGALARELSRPRKRDYGEDRLAFVESYWLSGERLAGPVGNAGVVRTLEKLRRDLEGRLPMPLGSVVLDFQGRRSDAEPFLFDEAGWKEKVEAHLKRFNADGKPLWVVLRDFWTRRATHPGNGPGEWTLDFELVVTPHDPAPAAGLEERRAGWRESVERWEGFRSAIDQPGWVVIGSEVAARFPGLSIFAGMEERVVIAQRDPADAAIYLAERGVSSIHLFAGLEEGENLAAIFGHLGIEAVVHPPGDRSFQLLLPQILSRLGVPGQVLLAGMEEFAAGLEELGKAA